LLLRQISVAFSMFCYHVTIGCSMACRILAHESWCMWLLMVLDDHSG